MKIYEIRDETVGDRYYSLGLFETLDAAKQAILEIPADCRISDTDDDYEKICVYERKIGWGDSEKLVFAVLRERDMESDDDVWITIVEDGELMDTQTTETTIKHLNELLEIKTEELEVTESELYRLKRINEYGYAWTQHRYFSNKESLPIPRLELEVLKTDRGLIRKKLSQIIPEYSVTNDSLISIPLHMSESSEHFNLEAKDITPKFFAGSSVAGSAVHLRDLLHLPLIVRLENEVVECEL